MQPLPPSFLRCEYLIDPLGLSTSAPRFSWVLESAGRSVRQAAFQVLVSPEPSFLEREIGDYWDSGRVESDAAWGIAYDGVPLWSGKPYFWKVRWWDGEGNVSPWSDPARFEMGLLLERDWKAKWISPVKTVEFSSRCNVTLGVSSGDFVQSLGIYLRKEFEVKEKIVQARVYVCGLGYFELRLNGRKVGDHVLDPAQTDYNKTALYSVFDITSEIREKNALAVILGNGRHLKAYGYGKPRLLLQVHLAHENELVERVVTDETWRTGFGAILENGIYLGERVDHRLHQDGWDETGFDDSSWPAAEAVKGPNPTFLAMPPIRVAERLAPQRMWSPVPEVHVFDFGQNFSGWVKLRAGGPRGREIRVRHAELVQADGTLNVLPNQNADATDVFVLGGQCEEVFEPRFTYHGFRYAEVSGFPGEPSLDSLEGCFVHSDVQKTGDFRCSHELLNRIHQNILWGQLSNLMSIPTDCPQRDERQGWLGDAHLAAEAAVLNFDMAAFYSKFLEDIRLSQKEDGSLPDAVPPYIDRLYPADPAWGIAYLEIAWLVYFYYGNERILHKHFAGMKKYVDHLTRNTEGRIVGKLGKYGDWCSPGEVSPKKTPLELTSTWSYYRAAVLLSQFAEVLGRADDVRGYTRLAEEIKTAFNARFLSGDQYTALRTGPADKSPSQTSNILPLALDMVPPEKKRLVIERLLESVVKEWDCHLDTGILGTRYLLDVLTEAGYGQTAFRVATQRTYPGWGYMVEQGATTLWERWEDLKGGGMNSHNHIMLGSIDAWLYRVVAGLRCDAPAWRKIIIRPPLFDGLTEASAEVKTVRGKAGVTWRRGGRRFELRVQVPVGAEAVVHFPLVSGAEAIAESGSVIWKDGEAAGRNEVVSFLRTENEYALFRVGSGVYDFGTSTRD
jgi:alpha-L-rhamnosidase